MILKKKICLFKLSQESSSPKVSVLLLETYASVIGLRRVMLVWSSDVSKACKICISFLEVVKLTYDIFSALLAPIPSRSLKPNPQVNRSLKPATLSKKFTFDENEKTRMNTNVSQSQLSENKRVNPSVFDKYDEPASTPLSGYGEGGSGNFHEPIQNTSQESNQRYHSTQAAPQRPQRRVPGYDEPSSPPIEASASFTDNTPADFEGDVRLMRRKASNVPMETEYDEPRAPSRPPKPSSSNSPIHRVPKATASSSNSVDIISHTNSPPNRYTNHSVAMALQKYQMQDDGYPELRQDYKHPKLHTKQSLRSQSSQDEHYEEHTLISNRTPSTDLLTPEYQITSDSRNNSVSSRSSVSTEESNDSPSLSYSNVMGPRRSMVSEIKHDFCI